VTKFPHRPGFFQTFPKDVSAVEMMSIMRAFLTLMPRVAVKIKAGGRHARVARGAGRVGGMKQKYDFKSNYY